MRTTSPEMGFLSHKYGGVEDISTNSLLAKEVKHCFHSPRYEKISDLLLPMPLQNSCHHGKNTIKGDRVRDTTCSIGHADSI